MASIEIIFIVKIIQKYLLLGQLRKSRANVDWSVPLSACDAFSPNLRQAKWRELRLI